MSVPRISMLLPARGRPVHLHIAVDSVLDLSADPDSVEFLARLDECDPHLQQELRYLLGHPRAQQIDVAVGPRLGYSRMHDYYNALAARARGDWLFVWNDDTEMVTLEWDRLLCEAPGICAQFPRRDITPSTDYTFPVVGRVIYSALGHISQNAYCDAWVSDYATLAGVSVVRDDVAFTHHRLNDQTLADQAGSAGEWLKFSEADQDAMRLADVRSICAIPGHAARFDGWEVEEVESKIHYLRQSEADLRARSYVLKGRK